MSSRGTRRSWSRPCSIDALKDEEMSFKGEGGGAHQRALCRFRNLTGRVSSVALDVPDGQGVDRETGELAHTLTGYEGHVFSVALDGHSSSCRARRTTRSRSGTSRRARWCTRSPATRRASSRWPSMGNASSDEVLGTFKQKLSEALQSVDDVTLMVAQGQELARSCRNGR